MSILSPAPHVSHPPACLDQARSCGESRGAKELHGHTCLLRSRLGTGNTISLLARASHKTSLGLRSEETGSASLAKELQNHTTEGLIVRVTHWDH